MNNGNFWLEAPIKVKHGILRFCSNEDFFCVQIQKITQNKLVK